MSTSDWDESSEAGDLDEELTGTGAPGGQGNTDVSGGGGESESGWRPDVTNVVQRPEDQDQIGDPAEPDQAAPGSGDDVIRGTPESGGGDASIDRGGGSSIGRDLEDDSRRE